MTWNNFLYKITKDLLVSLLITYFFLLIPEIVLPGIVSVHFSPKYFLVLILVIAWLHVWFARKNPAPQENILFRAISRNLLNTVLVVVTAMLFLSLYKMKIWEIFIVTIFSVALLIAAENMIVKEER